MTTIILQDVKTSLGVLPSNLAFDLELLMHINSATGSLYQLGVTEFVLGVTETSLWPIFANQTLDSTIKQYVTLKTKHIFDPIPNGVIANSMVDRMIELEGRITHEVEHVA